MLNQNTIQNRLKIIDSQLEMFYQVFLLLKPLIKEIVRLKITKQLESPFDINQTVNLLAEISKACKLLKIQDFSDEFYRNLEN